MSTRVYLVCVFIIAALPAVAQDPSAVLAGSVADQTGGAIVGALITATDLRMGLVFKQTTNSEGAFTFPALRVGEYSVTAEKQDFATYTKKPVQLNVNQTIRLQVVLEVVEAWTVPAVSHRRAAISTAG